MAQDNICYLDSMFHALNVALHSIENLFDRQLSKVIINIKLQLL